MNSSSARNCDELTLVFTFQGIIKRDELVFTNAKSRGIDIVMVTSGGYQKSNARIIADSIQNLFEKRIIELPS